MQRLKAAVGTARRASQQLPRPRPARQPRAARPPDSAASPLTPHPDHRLARAAVILTACAPTAADRSRVARTAPAVTVPAVAVSAPVSHRPHRLPCAGAVSSPARRAAPPRRAPREAVGRFSAAHVGRAPRGRGPRALCVWAEREFGSVAPG
jgi:hypothetical protein